MADLIKKFLATPFTLLDRNLQKLFLILFCGVFATVFLSLFDPFGISKWTFSFSPANKLPLAAFGVLGVLVLSFTQFGLRHWFNLERLTTGKFLLFTFVEFLLVTCAIFMVFGDENRPYIPEFLEVFKYTSLVLFIPYAVALLVLSLSNLRTKVRITQEQLNKVENKQAKQIHFKDENDKVVLSVVPDQIILLKSEANYTTVYYLIEKKIEKNLIRSNLKKIENEITDQRFFRVHRSYMVNLKQVLAINRNKRSYDLILKGLPEFPIPVSLSIKPAFKEKMGIS